MRLLALSRRFDMRPPIRAVQADLRNLEWLRRTTAPLLAAIDGILAGDMEAAPMRVLQALPPGAVVLLLDLFADAASLQETLCATETGRSEIARLHCSEIGDALDTLLWRLPWAKEMARFYEALQHRHLRSASYFLLAWPPAPM